MAGGIIDFINGGTGVHPVGERIAAWLRPYPAKDLARMFGVAPRTAKVWRVGQLPQMRHLIQMADRWGVAFLEDVFSPVLAETDTSLAGRLERIERDVSRLKEEAINEQNNRPIAGPDARLAGGKTHRRRPRLAAVVKTAGLILATIAVIGTMIPSDFDFARAPRPPQVRTGRTVRRMA